MASSWIVSAASSGIVSAASGRSIVGCSPNLFGVVEANRAHTCTLPQGQALLQGRLGVNKTMFGQPPGKVIQHGALCVLAGASSRTAKETRPPLGNIGVIRRTSFCDHIGHIAAADGHMLGTKRCHQSLQSSS